MSDSAAEITTAASAAWGRSASRPLKASSNSATSPAPTSPVAWVLAPAWSATAVREPLTETAKPWKSPAATLAMPTPTISWSGFTSSPWRAAKLLEVAMVSVSDTMVMPTAPTRRAPTSCQFVNGSAGVGTPWGRTPTVATPWEARSNTADATVAPTTATSTAGMRPVMRGRTRSTASTATPVTSVAVLRPSSPSKKALISLRKPSASVENPKSLGS